MKQFHTPIAINKLTQNIKTTKKCDNSENKNH